MSTNYSRNRIFLCMKNVFKISDASYTIITGYFLQIFLRKFVKNIRLLKISGCTEIFKHEQADTEVSIAQLAVGS